MGCMDNLEINDWWWNVMDICTNSQCVNDVCTQCKCKDVKK